MDKLITQDNKQLDWSKCLKILGLLNFILKWMENNENKSRWFLEIKFKTDNSKKILLKVKKTLKC